MILKHDRLTTLQVKLNRLKMQLMLSAWFFACTSLFAQQEQMYSQYMFNMTQINPAYVGNRAFNNVTALYRKQWVSIPGSPSTASLSWDKRQKGSNVGYGLQIYNDQLGIESTAGVQGFYSYRIPMDNSFLSFGISGGVVNYRADFSTVETTSGNDPLFQQTVNGWLPTAGIGVLYATPSWYAGFSAPALLHTKVDTDNPQATTTNFNHYFLTGGYIFELSDVIKLKPSVLFKAVQGAPLQFDFNLNAWVQNMVGLGLSYRVGDAVVGLVEVQISPEFRLGYAYDYVTSNLKNYSNGTHELMLRYEFNSEKTERVMSPRYY